MNTTVSRSVALAVTAAQKLAVQPRLQTPLYAQVGHLCFRSMAVGLEPRGWVIERIASLDFQQPVAGVAVVPSEHMVSPSPLVRLHRYVAVNPISGRIFYADDDAVSMVAAALVDLAFAAPFTPIESDRWNHAVIDLTMPAIAEFVIVSPRSVSNPGSSFYVVRRSDYDAWINNDMTGSASFPAIRATRTYIQAFNLRNALNATTQRESVAPHDQ